MSLKKCPRCELNYMQDSEKVCGVCKRDMCGASDKDEFPELCAQCGEHPVVPGEDLCVLCKKELKVEEGEAVKAMMDETLFQKEAMSGITSVSPMDVDEIVIDDENPPPGFDIEPFEEERESDTEDADEPETHPDGQETDMEKSVNQGGAL